MRLYIAIVKHCVLSAHSASRDERAEQARETQFIEKKSISRERRYVVGVLFRYKCRASNDQVICQALKKDSISAVEQVLSSFI